MAHSNFDPEYVFSHHTPTAENVQHYDAIHAAAKAFASVILKHTPVGADQEAALRLLREATMTANAAVALAGRLS
ncbi:MAG TPA: hypothetical protein VGM29_16850 [Polyangiaceae bacterium]|jgi:hypothetical protein